MAFDGRRALEIIEKIGHANAKGEYYLTDAVTVVRDLGLEAVVIETSEDEVRGINTKAQLAEAEQGSCRPACARQHSTPASP